MSLEAGVQTLLDLFEEAAKEPADRALLMLLKDNAEHLPPVTAYFRKAFRQTDVTPSGKVDAAIWLLIGSSHVFWACFDKAEVKEPRP